MESQQLPFDQSSFGQPNQPVAQPLLQPVPYHQDKQMVGIMIGLVVLGVCAMVIKGVIDRLTPVPSSMPIQAAPSQTNTR